MKRIFNKHFFIVWLIIISACEAVHDNPLDPENIRKIQKTIENAADPFSVPNYVAFLPDDSRAYVTNENPGKEKGYVSVINVNSDTVEKRIDVGESPLGIAVNPNGREVYVANYNSHTVSIIDTQTNTETKQIPVGKLPTTLAVTSDEKRLYVVNSGERRPGSEKTGDVSVIALTKVNRQEVDIIPIGGEPFGIVITPDDRYLCVSKMGVNEVAIIDTTNKQQDSIGVGLNPMDLALSTDGKHLYVSMAGESDPGVPQLYVIDIESRSIVERLTVGVRPQGIAVTQDSNAEILYVAIQSDSTISIVEVLTNEKSRVKKDAVPPSSHKFVRPRGIAVTHDGEKIYVINRGNGVSVLTF